MALLETLQVTPPARDEPRQSPAEFARGSESRSPAPRVRAGGRDPRAQATSRGASPASRSPAARGGSRSPTPTRRESRSPTPRARNTAQAPYSPAQRSSEAFGAEQRELSPPVARCRPGVRGSGSRSPGPGARDASPRTTPRQSGSSSGATLRLSGSTSTGPERSRVEELDLELCRKIGALQQEKQQSLESPASSRGFPPEAAPRPGPGTPPRSRAWPPQAAVLPPSSPALRRGLSPIMRKPGKESMAELI